MSATIDDVKRGHRHHKSVGSFSSECSKVMVKRQFICISPSASSSEGDSKDGVGANLLLAPTPFVLGAVDLLDHLFVDQGLFGDVQSL